MILSDLEIGKDYIVQVQTEDRRITFQPKKARVYAIYKNYVTFAILNKDGEIKYKEAYSPDQILSIEEV